MAYAALILSIIAIIGCCFVATAVLDLAEKIENKHKQVDKDLH